jgi:hypothetical protein
MVCTKRMKSNSACVKCMARTIPGWYDGLHLRGTTTTATATTTSTMDTHRLLPIIVWNHICVVTSLSPYSIVSLLFFVIVFLVKSPFGITTTCCRLWLDIRIPIPMEFASSITTPHISLSVCNKCIQHTAAIRNCSNVILNFCSDNVGIE